LQWLPRVLSWIWSCSPIGRTKVAVPKGIHTLMCYCGDNCKLVKCNILGYCYGMRLFKCVNYEHDSLPPCLNVRPKVIKQTALLNK
jgi:hypothetical protein